MKMLVVDDDPNMVEFVCQIAGARGYSDVDSAFFAEEALAMIIRADYDLITLDIRMPGASGLEILGLIRNLCPHAIIAVVSGYIPEEVSSDVVRSADAMICKPVELGTFAALMEGADRISRAREDIRLLSAGALAVR